MRSSILARRTTGITDSLFEAVALCSKELMKYSLSAEEFAVLAQKNGMTDSEILAVSKTFEYLRDKKKRESVEFGVIH